MAPQKRGKKGGGGNGGRKRNPPGEENPQTGTGTGVPSKRRRRNSPDSSSASTATPIVAEISASVVATTPNSIQDATTLDQVKELMEQEFNCSVCNEVYIEPSMLHCGHTFCKHCLNRSLGWSRRCPVCRASTVRTRPIKVITMDTMIAKLYEKMPQDVQSRRAALITERATEVTAAPPPAPATAPRMARVTIGSSGVAVATGQDVPVEIFVVGGGGVLNRVSTNRAVLEGAFVAEFQQRRALRLQIFMEDMEAPAPAEGEEGRNV